ncbi:MAG: pyrimidine reductase family protein [Micromonosporaceae bacterium]
MRQIYPGAGSAAGNGGTVDLAAAYAYPPELGEARRRWLRASMVASVDGAATLKGLSGGLSAEEDRRLFHLLRGLADVVLVGAGTVRAEGYSPARPRDEWAGLRTGRPPSPPIAVMTRMLDVDLSGPMFTEAPPHARTIVVTTEAAPARRRAEAARHADIVIAGTNHVDLPAAIAALSGRGLCRILAEGGPHLLGQLAAADLLDELCLTVSPLLVGGAAFRIMAGSTLPSPRRLRLAHVLESGGSLFCRYVRDR